VGWLLTLTKEQQKARLVVLTVLMLGFSAATVFFWQRDIRRNEGHQEAARLVSNLPCPEWGDAESEEVIGVAAAFFANHSDEFPNLSDEIEALRTAIEGQVDADSFGDSYELEEQIERSAWRARGMLIVASGGTAEPCGPF